MDEVYNQNQVTYIVPTEAPSISTILLQKHSLGFAICKTQLLINQKEAPYS